MKPELAGKVAVITGGGSGLGAAMGRTFAGVGMAVAALDVDEAASKKTAAALAEEFGVPTAGQPPRTVSCSRRPLLPARRNCAALRGTVTSTPSRA
ncbi:MAG TPA: SDR family NAD(P)-dependent oxidoreductase [Candidatus Dormibacteraeota bacterium]|nr:SDR family NAD(P)-dependent oxidoreductase [Candidatus Dormibacteraeota bacterium]